MNAAAARVRTARNTIVAGWECGRSALGDPATEAAQALEDRGLLQSPETAAAQEALRKDRDAFRTQRNGVFKTNERLIGSLQEEQDARLRAENEVRTLTRELEQLRAQVAAMEQQHVAAKDVYPPTFPWARWLDETDLPAFLDELAAAAIVHASSARALAQVEQTCATWRPIAESFRAHLAEPPAVVTSYAEQSAARLRGVLAPSDGGEGP